MTATGRRKDAHLALCAAGPVEAARGASLLGEVRLVPCALPELAEDEVELATTFLGKPLRAPLLITGMTGGTARGGAVNRALAAAAERHGLAFGVGSQRAQLERPEAVASYAVRAVAPSIPILGNLGLAQAAALPPARAWALAEAIGADGLAVHLNAAQELAQPEGDRDFTGGLDAIGRLAAALGPRLVVKETGCGLDPATCERLADTGVVWLDVAGAGGTAWVAVETLRGGRPGTAPFARWGIPTAAAVAAARRRVGDRAGVIASGGVRDGLDAAAALALGADLVGLALPLLRAFEAGGAEAVDAALAAVVTGLRAALVLTGCRTVPELRARPRVLGAELRAWLEVLA